MEGELKGFACDHHKSKKGIWKSKCSNSQRGHQSTLCYRMRPPNIAQDVDNQWKVSQRSVVSRVPEKSVGSTMDDQSDTSQYRTSVEEVQSENWNAKSQSNKEDECQQNEKADGQTIEVK